GFLPAAVLSAFRMPAVGRSLLRLLLPSQWLLTLATRTAVRLGFEWLRKRGYDQRFVLVVGTGPRAQAFARKLEDHRELGLRVLGFVDDEVHSSFSAPWRYVGSLDQIEDLLHKEVIDEVAICLPFG